MKKAIILAGIIAIGCQEKEVVYTPVGAYKEKSQTEISRDRARNLNILERQQIQDWIKNQDIVFYDMPLNYWINVPDLHTRPARKKGDFVTFEYDLYDFDNIKIYNKPKLWVDAKIGRFSELKAIEDAITYLRSGEEAILLVPSVLGYGTYGDGDKIGSDIPLIIHIKVL